MNTRFIKQALPAAITLAVAACGGGGVAPVITGIGGSGFIATGTVTGFGSVFVNGVEFETSGSVFDIDGSSPLMMMDALQGFQGQTERRGSRSMFLKARLKPGVSVERANQALQAFSAGLSLS